MFLKSNVHSMESASIIYKINNEIISNIDIEDEIRYLIALNNQLETVDNETIFKIAAQSLIKEKIKKNELLNYYLLDQKNPNLDNIIKDYYLKLGLNSDVNFEEYLKRYELKIEDIRKKIEIEATWNELIYTKYNSFLQIDEQKLRLKLKNQKPNNEKSYLLSEIIFEDNSNKKKYNLIKESIKEIGFSNTANIYSISDTSKFGGKIGWVKEQNLNEKILILIKNLEIGLYTEPFQVGSNFLVLRLEDIKEDIKNIDEEKALKQLVDFEIQRQMNRFSKTYYNKVKLNAKIEKK
jgi:peptidyl-prolyl cis-trans isomerase SurA